MANSVEKQLQKAKEMKSTVQEFSKILTAHMQNLQENLEQSVRAGFPEDIARKYHVQYFSPDNDTISQLSQTMNSEHVKFLDEVINDLTEAINHQ